MSTASLSFGPSHFRRIVTSRQADGTSTLFIDGVAKQLGTLHEFWRADTGGAGNCEEGGDPVSRPVRIAPPLGGSVFRFVEIEPESSFANLSDEERRERVRFAFSRVGAEGALVNTTRHAAMHQTDTIDYIVVLSGELTMLLDVGEVALKPFDVVVQRGTNHAWINRGDKPALLAAVLISAQGMEEVRRDR